MNTGRPAYLFRRYFNQTATEEEKAELMAWISRDENAEEVKALMDEAWEEFHKEGIIFTDMQSEKMLRHVFRQEPPVAEALKSKRGKGRVMRFGAVAAAAMLALIITGYFWLASREQPGSVHGPLQVKNDIAPGRNKAMLTLANGSVITLDSMQNGTLAHQGNTSVIKLNNGQLVYHPQSGASRIKRAIQYNTLVIPRGGQYRIVLPDGSKVWLNASSSLKFPTAFTAERRMVELTGEAYFEIEREESRPFYVKVPGGQPGEEAMTVEVLGTHFNVKAYEDEPSVKTTLLEGAVRVVKGSGSKLLQPGQQASISKGADHVRIRKADLDEVIAWKNGLFHFDGDNIDDIMRKIARWYDVEVTYKGAVPVGHYTGVISRNTNLLQVLKMLEFSGINFSVQGRKIIVTS